MQYLNLQLYLPEKTKTASKNPCLIAFSPPVPSDPPVITLSTFRRSNSFGSIPRQTDERPHLDANHCPGKPDNRLRNKRKI